MKEILNIIKHYDSATAQGLQSAIAIVVHVEQSSYRRPGARMLITENGDWTGGISGGCLEGDTLKKALFAIQTGESQIITYDTRDGDGSKIGVGLGCSGLIQVLVTPLKSNISTINLLRKVSTIRMPSILITDLTDGITIEAGQPSLAADIEYIVEEVRLTKRSSKTPDLFVEYLQPPPAIYIFGRNYDVIPMTEICNVMGWPVHIVANPLKVAKELFDVADTVQRLDEDKLQFDDLSVALLMSHDYQEDMKNLTYLQKHQLKYIGLLGPKKRQDKMLTELASKGIAVAQDNLYGPMGLDTGADTPEDIAISIIAEIKACFAGRKGTSLRYRIGSIY